MYQYVSVLGRVRRRRMAEIQEGDWEDIVSTICRNATLKKSPKPSRYYLSVRYPSGGSSKHLLAPLLRLRSSHRSFLDTLGHH